MDFFSVAIVWRICLVRDSLFHPVRGLWILSGVDEVLRISGEGLLHADDDHALERVAFEVQEPVKSEWTAMQSGKNKWANSKHIYQQLYLFPYLQRISTSSSQGPTIPRQMTNL